MAEEAMTIFSFESDFDREIKRRKALVQKLNVAYTKTRKQAADKLRGLRKAGRRIDLDAIKEPCHEASNSMARELLELRGLSDLLDMMRCDQLGEKVSKRDLVDGAAPCLGYTIEALTCLRDVQAKIKTPTIRDYVAVLPAEQADFHAILDLNLMDKKQFRTAVVRVFAVSLTHFADLSFQADKRAYVDDRAFLRDMRIQP
jgi:hypothetical protein